MSVLDRPLFDHQKSGIQFLLKHPKAYLADEPGLGKTTTVLCSLYEQGITDALVVASAMIRDTEVWESERDTLGLDLDLKVISYHQLARVDITKLRPRAVVFDESVRLKERKTSWWENARILSDRAEVVDLMSGTPMPNAAVELYGQLRMLRPEILAYWNWVKSYFDISRSQYTAYDVGRLKGCGPRCGTEVLDGSCEHWQGFSAAELEPWMIRRLRDNVLDLPPITGIDTPLWIPMRAGQKRVYEDMKKQFLAEVPEKGLTLEALNYSGQFAKLMQLSAGCSSADPELGDKQDSKAEAVAELLADRTRPTLLVCYYKNTADRLERLLIKMGKRYVKIGASSTRNQRLQAVRDFQAGKLDVMLASVMVVSEGITLTQADEIILAERPWRPDQMVQVIQRLHRIGQSRPVTVRQLVTPDSVDEGQWQTLLQKQSHSDEVLSPVQIASLV